MSGKYFFVKCLLKRKRDRKSELACFSLKLKFHFSCLKIKSFCLRKVEDLYRLLFIWNFLIISGKVQSHAKRVALYVIKLCLSCLQSVQSFSYKTKLLLWGHIQFQLNFVWVWEENKIYSNMKLTIFSSVMVLVLMALAEQGLCQEGFGYGQPSTYQQKQSQTQTVQQSSGFDGAKKITVTKTVSTNSQIPSQGTYGRKKWSFEQLS